MICKNCKLFGYPNCEQFYVHNCFDDPSVKEDDKACDSYSLEKIKYEAFSVIYTVEREERRGFRHDVPRGKDWHKTEDNKEEIDHIKGQPPVYLYFKKYCALLSPKKFVKFCEDMGLTASTTKTMGSIGAPGFGISWSPAMLFDCEYESSSYKQAYVTPCVIVHETPLFGEEPLPTDDGLWDRIREDILERMG